MDDMRETVYGIRVIFNAEEEKMSNELQVRKLTDIMAQFVGFTAKKLPDDVIAKLEELRDKEDSPMARVIYDTMFRNQELAVALDRPSCQDTGVLQFWVKCGSKFPLIDELEGLLKQAVIQATVNTPLRHNSVETFDEYNTANSRQQKSPPTVGGKRVRAPHATTSPSQKRPSLATRVRPVEMTRHLSLPTRSRRVRQPPQR